MDAHEALQRVDEFARRLGLTETSEPYRGFDLLTRDEQRELVTIARRFGAALDAGLTEHGPKVSHDRARRREAVEHAQVLQLRVDLLERAGGKLAAVSSDAEALAVWGEALRD